MSLYMAGRGGDDLYVDVVYTSAADVGLRLTKELESGGTWAVVAAATVSERGLRSGSTEEAFTLTGNRLYNPAWGVQQGHRRSGRVRREAVPFVMTSYTSSPWERTRLRISAGGDWGERHDEQLTDSTAQQTSGEPETAPEAAPQAAPYTELPLDAEGYPVE